MIGDAAGAFAESGRPIADPEPHDELPVAPLPPARVPLTPIERDADKVERDYLNETVAPKPQHEPPEAVERLP